MWTRAELLRPLGSGSQQLPAQTRGDNRLDMAEVRCGLHTAAEQKAAWARATASISPLTRPSLFTAHHSPCTVALLCHEQPRYGGCYVPTVAEDVDTKPEVDKSCEPGCSSVWETYKKCEARIEEKGRGECSGYYMDYFKCIDK